MNRAEICKELVEKESQFHEDGRHLDAIIHYDGIFVINPGNIMASTDNGNMFTVLECIETVSYLQKPAKNAGMI